MTQEARLKYKKQREEDGSLVAHQFDRNTRLMEIVHRAKPEDQEEMERIAYESNSFADNMHERLQTARDAVEKGAAWLTFDHELSDHQLANLAEIEDINVRLRQENSQVQQLNKEAEERAAKAFKQIKELREMNSQMAAQLHSAEERAKILEASAKAQQSRTGSTGLQPMGSQISDPEREELIQVRDQALNAENENQRLRAEVSRLQEQVRTLRQQAEQRPSAEPSIAVTTSREPLRTYTPLADYQWQITREYFMDLEERAKRMYNYEREVYELTKLIPQEHTPADILRLDSARLRAKIEKDWAEWELQYPEQVRSGYVKPPSRADKSLWEVQPGWRKDWMKKRAGTLQIYYDSPRDMRIDPTYCPTQRRYTWAEFEKLKERNPHVLNFPKVPEPLAYTELNDAWLADMCE